MEILGKTDFDLLPKNEALRSLKDDLTVMQSREPIRDRIERITRPSGEIVWVSATKIPWVDVDGCVHGIIGISRNVTKRIAAEQEAKRLLTVISQQVLKPLLVISPVLLATLKNKTHRQILKHLIVTLTRLRKT